MVTYNLYWMTGKKETATGRTVAEALKNKGYVRSTLESLDHCIEASIDKGYMFDSKKGAWNGKV